MIYRVYAVKIRYHKVLYGVFKVLVMWLLLKRFIQKFWIATAFVAFPDELSRDIRGSDGFFQREKCVQLVIAPTT